jgi:hypothetical protein
MNLLARMAGIRIVVFWAPNGTLFLSAIVFFPSALLSSSFLSAWFFSCLPFFFFPSFFLSAAVYFMAAFGPFFC